MAKSTLSFVCQNCGAAYNRWAQARISRWTLPAYGAIDDRLVARVRRKRSLG